MSARLERDLTRRRCPASGARRLRPVLAAALFATVSVVFGQAPPAPRARAELGVKQAGTEHRDCRGCHATHRAMGGALLSTAKPDDLCASCHQVTDKTQPSNPSSPRQIEVGDGSHSVHGRKAYDKSREIAYERIYDKRGGIGKLRAGCSGCHDSHQRSAMKLRQVTFNSRGEWQGGPPAYTAQVCFGCHAGPQAARIELSTSLNFDIGFRFTPQGSSASSHRIGKSAKDRPDLPSLNGTSFSGRMDCTSCHTNPDKSGSRGPHISINQKLLMAPFGTETTGVSGPQANDLCYACHSQASIERDESFPLHRSHILGSWGGVLPSRGLGGQAGGREDMAKSRPEPYKPGRRNEFKPRVSTGQGTPCATCHDPHGSPQAGFLISFDPQVVHSSSVGGPIFQSLGMRQGACTLACHGKDHVQERYGG